MNLYQRKTLGAIVALYVVFGCQQYLVNQAVVLPSPLNPVIFLLVTLFFSLKTLRNSIWVERGLMFSFLIVAVIQFFTDGLMLQVVFGIEHEVLTRWMQSQIYQLLPVIGLVFLLVTLPIIALQIRKIHVIHFAISIVISLLVFVLAFWDLPLESLYGLGALAFHYLYMLRRYNEQLLPGVSATMHSWMIYFLLQFAEYWNLLL